MIKASSIQMTGRGWAWRFPHPLAGDRDRAPVPQFPQSWVLAGNPDYCWQ